VRRRVLCHAVAFAALVSPVAAAGDWPMWRFDAAHTAVSPDALSENLYLQWVLELPAPAPAWPHTQTKLQFDLSYEPVVEGDLIFVASMVHDAVTAYDTETGTEIWRFYANGPVRFAPALANGKVYVGSDDGCLYCLDAATGAVNWSFFGGPSARKNLGNKRLISSWPLRGAPVVFDGTVYFAAGVWPFMGLFLYALDADTGDVIWTNTGDGARWTSQQHEGAYAFATVAPQGYTTATANTLLVSGGRTVPAAFDRATGQFLYFDVEDRTWDKDQGGYAVAAIGDWFVSGPGHRATDRPGMYRISNGSAYLRMNASVLTDRVVYDVRSGDLRALDISGSNPTLDEKWRLDSSVSLTAVFCKAGSRLYAGRNGRVVAIEDLGASGVERWVKTIVGTPTTMLAADEKLFVVTTEGYLYCFGETDTGASLPSSAPHEIAWPAEDGWTIEANAILAESGVDQGYCLVLGLGTGRLAEELVHHSDLCVVGLDPSETKIRMLRARWQDMGIPGERLAAFPGDVRSAGLPPYLASLIASEDPEAAGVALWLEFAEKVFYSLRPYGGIACFPLGAQALFAQCATHSECANAEASVTATHAMLARVGPLPGSAPWTHQYGDAANSVKSDDQLVKAPFGILWFGGSSNEALLPRHSHGPPEQIIGGRLFIEGSDIMRALDVYTGRVLWEASLPGIGAPFNVLERNPGANHIGTNYACAEDGVYVAYGEQCIHLDPATGAVASTLDLPGNHVFSQVKIWDDLLIAAADPKVFDSGPIGENNWNATCSEYLCILDRSSGELLWYRRADNAFHHNTIIIGNGTLFCIDRLPPGQEAALARRGLTPKDIGVTYKILALDVRTGTPTWRVTENVFGTWLGYSKEYDVLLQSGRPSRDMVAGEPEGRLIAYHASDGALLWDKTIEGTDNGPYILHARSIITQNDLMFLWPGRAYDLLTGEPVLRTHPLSGKETPWSFTRAYGCNTAIASEHLITFRSGAAGYYDLTTNGGTGTLGGFKSGCTSNLIAADGVLNAPDYTRACWCAYQHQTSLAMVHMPEAEMWTFDSLSAGGDAVKQVGLNLGAPGDRVADNGVLWMDHPSVGYTSPNVYVRTMPTGPTCFRQHAAFIDGEMPWVGASGVTGLTSIDIKLKNTEDTAYTVRLYFAEPDDVEPGQRVFSIQLQGHEVLTDFDIVAEARAPRRTVVKEFNRIQVANMLEIDLAAAKGLPTVLCGVEALVDTDSDGLADVDEAACGTNPQSTDTDRDGVSDYEEVWYDGSGDYNPYNPISNPSGTDLDAHSRDTDCDGVSDAIELELSTSPIDPEDVPDLPLGRLAVLILLSTLLGLAGIEILRRRNVIASR